LDDVTFCVPYPPFDFSCSRYFVLIFLETSLPSAFNVPLFLLQISIWRRFLLRSFSSLLSRILLFFFSPFFSLVQASSDLSYAPLPPPYTSLRRRTFCIFLCVLLLNSLFVSNAVLPSTDTSSLSPLMGWLLSIVSFSSSLNVPSPGTRYFYLSARLLGVPPKGYFLVSSPLFNFRSFLPKMFPNEFFPSFFFFLFLLF